MSIAAVLSLDNLLRRLCVQNVTFLRDVAYPFLDAVGDFYVSYVTADADGVLHVLNACAQVRLLVARVSLVTECHARSLPTQEICGGSTVGQENDDTQDLAYARQESRAEKRRGERDVSTLWLTRACAGSRGAAALQRRARHRRAKARCVAWAPRQPRALPA